MIMPKDAYDALTHKLRFPKSKYLRKALELLISMEEAQVLAELPTPSEEIAKKLNRPKKTVDAQIEAMIDKGLIGTKISPEGQRQYFFGAFGSTNPESFVDGVTHAIAGRHWDDKTRSIKGEKNQEIIDLLFKFCEEEWYRWERVDKLVHRKYTAVGVGFTQTVFPAWKALEKSGIKLPESEFYWDARNVARRAKHISPAACACRIRARRCDLPIWTCTTFDLGMIPYETHLEEEKRGVRRSVQAEEWIELIGKCEELGMVHIGAHPFAPFVCTCDTCCCNVFVPLIRYAKPSEGLEKSYFRAVVNKETCQGCPNCISKCRFEAIKIVKDSATGKSKPMLTRINASDAVSASYNARLTGRSA